MRFESRHSAGTLLAAKLEYKHAVVLGIPRGGVAVAAPIAEKLKCPLGAVVAKKIALPSDPELAFGAMARFGDPIYDEAALAHVDITDEQLRSLEEKIRNEIERREQMFERRIPLEERNVVIVDDGLATGYTMLAALQSVPEAARRIVAVPVSSLPAYEMVKKRCDEIVCLHVADMPFFAVGSLYDDFHDMTDEEVISILEKTNKRVV